MRAALLKLLRRAKWCLIQPREQWLAHRSVQRIRLAAGQPITPQLAVLVTDSVNSRVCKIGYGLKYLGWRTVLLHQRALPTNPGQCFDECQSYATPSEALHLATRFRPVAYHVFSNWNFDVATLLIRHKPGKIVFDNYDVLAGTLLKNFAHIYHREIEQERFCLENADGLCCRDLESQCVKRSGYRFGGRRILIMDCCWGGLPMSPKFPSRRDSGFHVVNCGNIPIGTESEWVIHQKELSGVAKALIGQGLLAQSIHFHIYPVHGAWTGAKRESTVDAGTSNGISIFFHLHDRVPPDQLQGTLMQYDAGLYHVLVGANPPTYNHWKFVYTSGNRVFDYLDAGLPVIIHGSKFMEFVVRRAGVDIRVEEQLSGQARRYLRGENTESLRQTASRASSRLAITRHIPKLAAFYESL